MLAVVVGVPVGGIVACAVVAWLVVCCAMKRKGKLPSHAAAGAFDEKGTAPMLTSGEAARKASKKASKKFEGAGSLVSTGSQMASQI